MNNQQDNSDIFVIFFATVIVAVMVYFMLKMGEPWVNASVGYMAWIHVLPFSQVGRWLPFLTEIPLLGDTFFSAPDEVRRYLEKGGFAYMGVNDNNRFAVMTISGRCAMVFYVPLMIWAGLKGATFRADEIYRKFHTLESLIRANAAKWPGMAFMRDTNPRGMNDLTAKQIVDAAAGILKQSPPEGVGKLVSGVACDVRADGYMRSATPEEWLLMKGICWDSEEYDRIRGSVFAVSDDAWTMPAVWRQISIESISEALEAQLVNRWAGIPALPPAMRALFAVFVTFYQGGKKVKDANKLLDEIMTLATWAHDRKIPIDRVISDEEGFLAKVDKIIASKDGERMEAICAKHAYVETAIVTALKTCREGRGVLAPASFLWMKRYNRLWWYILNNTGSEAMMIECAGAMAHNKSELQIGMPLVRPCVWQAAKALHQDYLDLDPERVKARDNDKEKRRKLSETLEIISTQVEAAEARGAYAEKWVGESGR